MTTSFQDWSEQFTKYMSLRIVECCQGVGEVEAKQLQRSLEELLLEWHRAWLQEVEHSRAVVACTHRMATLANKLPPATLAVGDKQAQGDRA